LGKVTGEKKKKYCALSRANSRPVEKEKGSIPRPRKGKEGKKNAVIFTLTRSGDFATRKTEQKLSKGVFVDK